MKLQSNELKTIFHNKDYFNMKTRKNNIVTIRVTQEEKKLLKEKARRQRKTLSAYILSETINNK